MILEEQTSDSPYVYMKWRAVADHDGVYTGLAMEYWTFFFREENGAHEVVIGAPHAETLTLPYKKGGVYWGVLLKPHLFMPWLSKQDMSPNGFVLLTTQKSLLIDTFEIAIPTYEKAEYFVGELIKQGIVIASPLVEKALAGKPSLSERTVQRHVLQVAGLTKRELLRIRKARRAYALLQRGMSIGDVVSEAGYTDQAHLTKSLKLLAGQTPGQILSAYKKQQD